jgi:hypothetical protein
MFKHPTISDAYASLVADNPELLDFYLAWTRIEKLTREVTCGEVGLEGVRVVVPDTRFAQFVGRLRELEKRRDLIAFLSSRCSNDFLQFYLTQNGRFGESLSHAGSPLSLAPEVTLLGRLQEGNLLREEWRTQFVNVAKESAIEVPDLDVFAYNNVRRLFKAEELESLRQQVRAELIPNLDSFIDGLRGAYSEDEDPDEWFSSLGEVIEILQREFVDDAKAMISIRAAEAAIGRVVQGLHEDRWTPDEPDDDDYGRGQQARPTRSIFDDVDE